MPPPDPVIPALAVAPSLLAWYSGAARQLPWRLPPGSALPPADSAWPYRVWLSEVMLQQTTVAAVTGYFERFIARWPTVTALAAAGDDEVMAAWAGLGYYARARNLLACAREVAGRGGVFPATEAELRALPGLGAYTAAAVAAIAFGEPAVVVDANVERVVSRLFAIATPLPGGRAEIRRAAAAITPAASAGDFAQAMMDLGASICTSRRPRCGACPLAGLCKARRVAPERFPVKPPRRVRPERRGRAWWIERDGAVWLVRRPGRGMLGGMRALPDDGWHAGGDGLGGAGRLIGAVTHGFTHFTLHLELALCAPEDWAGRMTAGEWWPKARLAEAGLPSLFARAARLALAEEGEKGG
ncbi:MAG: A/G-specific adenine glycosylase [Sphingomonadales bacterium]|nr:A/G-specific adenine glycosylase [Sphingomonadales bacterium]